ncbi:MAG: hypothetical protein M9918_25440 [Anaerolineae bacterium]|nr:hypothetical protein [Anaerolineae bacterium]
MPVAKTRHRRSIGFFILVGISIIAYAGLVRLDWQFGTLRAQAVPQTIGWYLLAFFAFVGTLFWAERHSLSMKWVWAAAILFRLLLLLTTPTLSDDIYRYLWDGHVANNGVSPYAYAIDSAELDFLDIPIRAQANNTWMASPYLPAAQVVFATIALLFPLQPLFLQIAMVAFDLHSGVMIAKLLVLAALPARRLLIYLWNPLVIVEVAHGAHIDAWMVLLTLLAVWLTFKSELTNAKRSRWAQASAPMALALATLTKILPVLTLPVLFWRWSWRQWLIYGTAVVALLLPAGIRAGWGLSGELDGTGVFGALRIYGGRWKFNSGIVFWLEQFLQKQGVTAALLVSKVIVAVLMVAVLLIVWRAARRRTGFRPSLRLMSLPFMAYILLTPTVHPWYTIIVIAFLPFVAPADGEHRRLWLLVLPWLYLSGALIFSYLAYLNPQQYGELEWVRQLEWLPVFALLFVAGLLRVRSR